MDWRLLVPAPERLEVVGEADLPAAVHLGRLAVELWQGDLGRRHGERHWDVKLDVELVLEELVDVPALAEPPRPLLVRLKPEASIIGGIAFDFPLNGWNEVKFASCLSTG